MAATKKLCAICSTSVSRAAAAMVAYSFRTALGGSSRFQTVDRENSAWIERLHVCAKGFLGIGELLSHGEAAGAREADRVRLG